MWGGLMCTFLWKRGSLGADPLLGREHGTHLLQEVAPQLLELGRGGSLQQSCTQKNIILTVLALPLPGR